MIDLHHIIVATTFRQVNENSNHYQVATTIRIIESQYGNRITQSSVRPSSVSPSSYRISNVAVPGITAVMIPGCHSTLGARKKDKKIMFVSRQVIGIKLIYRCIDAIAHVMHS